MCDACPANVRLRRPIHFGRSVSHRRRISGSRCSGRTRISRWAMPTGSPFPRDAASPAHWRGFSRCWPAYRPGFAPPERWSLDAWAERGVLLLNPALTVEIGWPGSHERCGWQALTSQPVALLCRALHPPVFLLWGAKAQSFFASAAARHRVPGAHHPASVLRTSSGGSWRLRIATSWPLQTSSAGGRSIPWPAAWYSPRFVSEGCPSG